MTDQWGEPDVDRSYLQAFTDDCVALQTDTRPEAIVSAIFNDPAWRRLMVFSHQRAASSVCKTLASTGKISIFKKARNSLIYLDFIKRTDVNISRNEGGRLTVDLPKPALHFVRFADNHGPAFTSAVKVFGPPAFLHRKWDQRAQRDIAPGDTVVFARGDADQPISRWNGDDEFYQRGPK
jgi:hypothetical protein